MSGQVRMDGWVQMGSDDEFPIKQVFSVRLAWGSVLVLGLLGSVFHRKNWTL
jgi:hypothetical protein